MYKQKTHIKDRHKKKKKKKTEIKQKDIVIAWHISFGHILCLYKMKISELIPECNLQSYEKLERI